MPPRRVDPTQDERNRKLILDSIDAVERHNRVLRSQAAARKSAADYKATGEGTLGEAWNHLLEEKANERYVNKYGGPPSPEGAAQIGFTKPDDTI